MTTEQPAGDNKFTQADLQKFVRRSSTEAGLQKLVLWGVDVIESSMENRARTPGFSIFNHAITVRGLSEGIADRCADAPEMISGVVAVVVDPVIARLGTDKKTALEIKLEATAEVDIKGVAGADRAGSTALAAGAEIALVDVSV